MLRYSAGIVLMAENALRDREISALRCALANLTEVVAQVDRLSWAEAERLSGIYHAFPHASALLTDQPIAH